MFIHFYAPETGAYLSSALADPDPLNDQRWLIPANATTTPLPTRTRGTWPFYRHEAWTLQPDYRGLPCYRTDTGEPAEIKRPGISPEQLGFTTTPRPSARHVWIDGTWEIPQSVIDAEKRVAIQQAFEARMSKAKRANAGKADALAAGLLTDEEAYYFKAWSAYQMALASTIENVMDSGDAISPDAVVWPSEPAPYVAPAEEPTPEPTATPAPELTQADVFTPDAPPSTGKPRDATQPASDELVDGAASQQDKPVKSKKRRP